MRFFLFVLAIASCFSAVANVHAGESQALSSLHSYTGIWNMPNARVVPDWNIRLKYGNHHPYRYYGGALGILDRIEVHGQFTEVSSIEAFVGEGYGNYKDRSAGLRLVLMREDEFWPQVALGFFDATGTALFANRYLAASKIFGNFDLTLGLGQGILAGEFVRGPSNAALGEDEDQGYSFLTSSPTRKTRPFGGIEWHATPDLTLSVEYSPIEYEHMFGYRTTGGEKLKEDTSKSPVNVGIKYKLHENIHAQFAWMHSDAFAGGVSFELPLEPEGMLPWKKIKPPPAGEGLRWQAYTADNDELAELVAKQVKKAGFVDVAAIAGDHSLWIEAENKIHLSTSRALGHIVSAVLPILPERTTTLYLNLKQNGQIIQSLRTSRDNLQAFLKSSVDDKGFLTYADLDLYSTDNWQSFLQEGTPGTAFEPPDDRFFFSINPRIYTFLNNRRGFFKHKGIVQGRSDFNIWQNGWLIGELELTLFNQYDELAYSPLEDDSVRTDLVEYAKKSDPRITMLALDQFASLPWNVQGRFSAGIFESAYAGFGAEVFRYFKDGLFGVGFEAEAVRKRDIEDNFKLRNDLDQWFETAYLNLYGQLWPEQGVEAGLKIGRFLAGDPGAKFEIRRSFKYFTIGAWYTATDTSRFQSEQNQGNREKGIYINIPLSLFKDYDAKGGIRYTFTSFTRDPGQTVRQPSSLYPMNPWATPVHTKQTLNDMRIQ